MNFSSRKLLTKVTPLKVKTQRRILKVFTISCFRFSIQAEVKVTKSEHIEDLVKSETREYYYQWNHSREKSNKNPLYSISNSLFVLKVIKFH